MNKNRSETIKIIPSAKRLVNSLRDLGYDFSQAVADLVDNSITAGAQTISIDLRFDGPDSWFRLVDDGCGMTGSETTEAMRYGAQQSYGDEDLGKFGLGLKTASLSQCRRLTVASRRGPSRKRIEVRQLDLDHVSECDSWEIFVLSATDCEKRVVEPLHSGSGTVVMWESLDRVLGYKIPWGRRAESALESLAEQLELHLGMTFHRFISAEVAGRDPISITINNETVPAWDPFARSEKATVVLPATDIDVTTSESVGLVRFQPYVLPPREQFSSDEAFNWYSGPRKWNAQQGFYIYRANRLIQGGGWCRMRALDEHLKLARAALDFYPELDSAFEINVSKARAVLPADLRENLQVEVEDLARTAQAAYRSQGLHEVRSTSRGTNHDVRDALEGAARRTGGLRALKRIVKDLQETNSSVAKRLGW